MSLKGVIFDDKKFKTKGNRGYTTRMLITKDWLESCQTDKGAYTHAQVLVLVEAGLIPPFDKSFPPHGWARRIIGKTIPDDLAERFRENQKLYKTKRGYRVRDSDKEQGDGNLSLF